MPPDDLLEYDDISEAVRAGRPLRRAKKYRFLMARGDLDFKVEEIADPVPLGGQLLEAAGLDRRDDWCLTAVMPSGDIDDVHLDEPFDLRGRGAERFIAFQSDRLFKLTIDGREIDWGKPAISGKILYRLADVREGHALFLQVRGGADKSIEPVDLVDLSRSGIEHFITAARPVPTFTIIVNARPRVVTGARVTFEEIVAIAFPTGQTLSFAYSMTYRKAASAPHSGELGAGGSVEIKDGTIFNVTQTVQS